MVARKQVRAAEAWGPLALVLVLLAACQSADGLEWRFDFQPKGYPAAAGYTVVKRDALYSAEQGYGFINYEGTPNDDRWRVGSNDTRVQGVVFLGDERSSFALDLPNGDYYVTYATGDPQYSVWQRPVVEGVTFRMPDEELEPAGAPLMLVDVWQDNWNVGTIPPERTAANAYWNIRTYGYQTEGHGNADILLLDRYEVTIADGQLNVGHNGTNKPMNFLIVESTTETLMGDANGDTLVDDDDLSLLLAHWQQDVGWENGNFSGDNIVDDDDLSLLLANWTGSSSVPEPATLSLLALACCLVYRRRR